ncbi:uncharacterized protein LOC119261889 [Pygocentrus nattereri]|uniref:uncharacterized protein LOC119261889 n=1 Tax=Pygocentrus nattereri TaxID=42514 RepID=UPI001890F22F|nr:uncharacterized protein LOC119261889 [Pygocentrus nattereri]XP_037387826.1 uncharacterized protein LOC119261889 [Pygocentrus nattereri]XP_037387827.1 uncharacterized protein LOC119261889 [Pygocentrus nattereri]XP_037387828.1 uncharacterized protein LOC119261889 [Pygocentrus nattereri]
MTQAITELQVSTNMKKEEDLKKQGFTKVDGNLNSGTTGPEVFLWYKKGGVKSVTRIQCSYRNEMNDGLGAAGFQKIKENINIGTEGDAIFLWYMTGTTTSDIAIMDLKVTTLLAEEPRQFSAGWERLGLDLNHNTGGNPVYLWVKRDTTTYISNITASLSFSEDKTLFDHGYIRVDEDTNRGASPSLAVFLWYRRCKYPDVSITDIDVSISEEQEGSLLKKGYLKVNKDLNAGTNGDSVYLWYKHSENPAIQFLTVLVGNDALQAYKSAKTCKVVEKNLNNGNNGVPLYVAYK